jgi:pilus assembly protein Flp/PilA
MNMLSLLVMKAQMILNREEGQDLIEYALLVALISLAAVAAISTIGTDISTVFTNIAANLNVA